MKLAIDPGYLLGMLNVRKTYATLPKSVLSGVWHVSKKDLATIQYTNFAYALAETKCLIMSTTPAVSEGV